MRCQTVDCQWNLISPHTLRGLRDPDACAVLRFNVLIVSAITDIAAQSDCRLEKLLNYNVRGPDYEQREVLCFQRKAAIFDYTFSG